MPVAVDRVSGRYGALQAPRDVSPVFDAGTLAAIPRPSGCEILLGRLERCLGVDGLVRIGQV